MAAQELQEFCEAEKRKIFASRNIKVQEKLSKTFDSLEVSEEDIAKASKVIEEVDKLLPQCPKRHECTFLIPKADFFTRKALSRAFFNDEEQGRKNLQTAMTILRKAKLLSTQLNMTKETTGINQRMERIEHLLQDGLRQYMERIRQPEPINYPREMVNETSNIEELILNVRLENMPNLNQWQWCQCTEGAEKA